MNPKRLENPFYVSIILVTDDVMDSGNERHQTLMRSMREEFRFFGKYRTLQCLEGGAYT